MANCALNPIVYGTLNKEFGQVFKTFFAHLKCNRQKYSANTNEDHPMSTLIDKTSARSNDVPRTRETFCDDDVDLEDGQKLTVDNSQDNHFDRG